MKAVKSFLSIGIFLLLVGSAAAEKPQLILISNEIDFELNQELTGFLNESFGMLRVNASDFQQHKESPRILILGGPDAAAVGGFVSEVLEQSWQDELRTKKWEKNVYIESSKWAGEQIIVVVAGNTRYDTQAIAQQEKERVASLLNFKKPFSKVSAEELKGKIDTGMLFTLLDVRPKSVFDAEHIKSAVNIPFAELAVRYTELDKNKEVITYCQNGKLGAVAAQTLINLGFERASNLRGGMDAWKERFGTQSIEATAKQPLELKAGTFEIRDGKTIDVNGVRITFAYSPGGCHSPQEYFLKFVKIENGTPVGKPSLLSYLEPESSFDDITKDVHALGFLLGYTIKVPHWRSPITITISPA